MAIIFNENSGDFANTILPDLSLSKFLPLAYHLLVATKYFTSFFTIAVLVFQQPLETTVL